MRKTLAVVLALNLILCGLSALADAGSEPDWTEYDRLIEAIKAETDYAAREHMMHHAEELLMQTGAVLPLYYDNSMLVMREKVSGAYNNPFGATALRRIAVEGSDTLTLCLGGEPDKLDPALLQTINAENLVDACFGGLYARDEKGRATPNFATDCEMSADGLTYTFTMREGLRWTDGTPLDARDFEYSWKRAADPRTGSGYSYIFNIVKGYPDEMAVSASENGRTFTVELAEPCAYFLDMVCMATTFAVPRSAVEAAPNASLNPGSWALEAGFVCSGPFVMSTWKHGEYIELTKNPDYWDAENVKLEKLVLMLTTDDNAAYNAYLAGDLDLINFVPPDEVIPLRQTPEFHTFDRLGTKYIAFNVKSHLFDDMTVEQAAAMRRALALLIDRDYLVETVGQRGQKPANCIIPYTMSDGQGDFFKTSDPDYHYPVVSTLDSGEKAEGYFDLDVDVKGAIALLKQAGFAFDGDRLSAATPLVFELSADNSAQSVNLAQCIQQDLAEVGIEAIIHTYDIREYITRQFQGRYDVCIAAWVVDCNDPVNMLEIYASGSGNNTVFLGR